MSLTPDNLPQLITELKSSLSEKNHPTITTSKPTVSTVSSQPPSVSITPSPPPSEMAPHVPSPREIQPLSPLLGKTIGLLAGDLGKVLLLVRGSSWRKPTQKIALECLRVKSPWNGGKFHLPPLLLRPKPMGRSLHRLQNLNALNINNHH